LLAYRLAHSLATDHSRAESGVWPLDGIAQHRATTGIG
jgi:hypothetical protein